MDESAEELEDSFQHLKNQMDIIPCTVVVPKVCFILYKIVFKNFTVNKMLPQLDQVV